MGLVKKYTGQTNNGQLLWLHNGPFQSNIDNLIANSIDLIHALFISLVLGLGSALKKINFSSYRSLKHFSL